MERRRPLRLALHSARSTCGLVRRPHRTPRNSATDSLHNSNRRAAPDTRLLGSKSAAQLPNLMRTLVGPRWDPRLLGSPQVRLVHRAMRCVMRCASSEPHWAGPLRGEASHVSKILLEMCGLCEHEAWYGIKISVN